MSEHKSFLDSSHCSSFEQYKSSYEKFIALTRENGVIECRFHHEGGPAVHSWEAHHAWREAWIDIGRDRKNEVLIVTGTGDRWQIGNPEVWTTPFREWDREEQLALFHDSRRLIENMVFNIDIPTIGIINGPGTHCELATLCDITLCAEDADFFDPHFLGGTPPGDGMALILQRTIGVKRAAYYAYTGQCIDGRTAVELGLANECLPREELLPRAREIAGMMMERSKMTRHLTHAILSRPWKQAVVQDMGFHLMHQSCEMTTDREGAFARLMKNAHRFRDR